jgi:hypothetical protein
VIDDVGTTASAIGVVIGAGERGVMADGVGRTYLHYKGGRYLLIAIAERHTHNGDYDAVYVSLERGKLCSRPYQKDSRLEDSWTDLVVWPDFEARPRFLDERFVNERDRVRMLTPAGGPR